MVRAIVRGYNLILNGMAVLAGILIFFTFVLIVVDVTMRTAGLTPPLFTISVVEYILLWFTMLAAPWLTRIKGHVFIDAVTQFMPAAVKNVTAKIVYGICIVSATIYSIHAARLFLDSWQNDKVDVRGVDMLQWTLFFPMPVCFFFVAIEFARYLIGIDDMYSHSVEEREGV